MTSPPNEIVVSTVEQRPDLADGLWELGDLWPTFLQNDPTADLYYDRCLRLFPDLVIVAEDPSRPGVVAARGFAIPFAARANPFPDGGWDAIIRWGIEDLLDTRPPTHVSALEIAVRPTYRGTGLATRLIQAMRDAAAQRGVERLVAPVRPTGKSRVPTVPMEDYADRRRPDGLPTDPWLRTHVRAGAEIVGIARRSMTIVGSLAEWRDWTGTAFDRPGPVVVDGALVPVTVDLEWDRATYVEPNVWVTHRIS